MQSNLLDALKEKYGSEYDIEGIEKFLSINITTLESESGDPIFKLRIKSDDGCLIFTTWHTQHDTILEELINK